MENIKLCNFYNYYLFYCNNFLLLKLLNYDFNHYFYTFYSILLKRILIKPFNYN